MKVTKVMKYQLIYIDDDVFPFKDFMNKLYELQKEMFHIANRAIQLHWEFSGYQSDYKTRFDAYPSKEKLEEELGYSNIRSFIYNEAAKEFHKNNKGNVAALLQKVDKKYKNEQKEYYFGTRSIASFKSDMPIELQKNSIKIEQCNPNNEKEYIMTISLFSNKFKEETGSLNGAFRFKIVDKNSSSNSILRSIVCGEYSHTSSSIKIKNGKIF